MFMLSFEKKDEFCVVKLYIRCSCNERALLIQVTWWFTRGWCTIEQWKIKIRVILGVMGFFNQKIVKHLSPYFWWWIQIYHQTATTLMSEASKNNLQELPAYNKKEKKGKNFYWFFILIKFSSLYIARQSSKFIQ